MASVQELKDALATDQARALELADRALAAIDTISTVSGVAIGILGLLATFLGLIGYSRIRASAREAATKIAEEHLKTYIGSDDFEKLMERKVAEEAQKRWQNTVVLQQFTAPTKQDSEASPFPEQEG